MLKKILAGTLGVSMILTSLAADSFSKLNANKSDRSQGTQKDLTAQTEPIRSLSDIHAGAEPIDLANTGKVEAKPEVSNVEFDIETGELKVWTKQDRNAQLVVSIIPEEGRESQLDMKTSLIPEPMTVSTFSVDTETLPEFFEIRAVIADEISGVELSESFNYRYYTESIQKMAKTYATDFDEEYVVNLDEDEKTNFLVLNENTIVAESDDSKNTIVKADYESNVYELENIDDTVKDLKAGDSFFAQHEGDMVAVTIDQIEIEDGKATITGSKNMESVFDFVKIETSFAIDNTENEPDPTVNEGISSTVEADDYMSLFNNTGKDIAHQFAPDYMLYQRDEIFGNDVLEDGFIGRPTADLSSNIDFVVYWDPGSLIHLGMSDGMDTGLYVKFVIEHTAKYDIRGKSKSSVELSKAPLSTGGVHIPILPMLHFRDQTKAVCTATHGFLFKCTECTASGFVLDTSAPDGEEFNIIAGTQIDDKDTALALGSAGFIGLEKNVDLTLWGVLDLSINEKNGFEFDTPGRIDYDTVNNGADDKNGVYTTDKTDDKAVHICDNCIEGKMKMVIDNESHLEVQLPSKKTIVLPVFNKSYKGVLFSQDYHVSYSKNLSGKTFPLPAEWAAYDEAIDAGFGKCSHKAYKAVFNVYKKDENDEKEPMGDLRVVIAPESLFSKSGYEKAEVMTDANGQAVVYLADLNDAFFKPDAPVSSKKYKYAVYDSDNKVLNQGTVEYEFGVQTLDIDLSSKTSLKKDVAEEATEAPGTFTIDDEIDYTDVIEKTPVQTLALGENIVGFVFPKDAESTDLVVRIFGYGEMSDFTKCQFNNSSNIKEAYIENYDPKNGLVITNLAPHLFSDCKNLETVSIPSTIKTIGEMAFLHCEELKALKLIDKESSTFSEAIANVEEIGPNAFQDCQKLEIGDLRLGDKLTTIGDNAFSNCLNITSLYIPENLKSVGYRSFFCCSNLNKLEIENIDASSKLEIKDKTAYANALEEAWIMYYAKETIIDNGTVIPDEYFKAYHKSDNGFGIVTVSIPSTIKKIGEKAFLDCKQLKTIKLVDKESSTFSEAIANVEEIGPNAFQNCQKLEIGDLRLGDKLTTIGDNAFSNCLNITSLYIPENLKSVGYRSFFCCSNLNKLEIENIDASSKLEIKDKTAYANALEEAWIMYYAKETIIDNGTVIPDEYFKAYHKSDNGFGIVTVLIPNTIKSICKEAFMYCPSLTTIYYNGTKAQWDEKVKDNIGEGNDVVTECYNEENGRKIVYLGGAAVTDAPLYGDANCDGKVTLSDALAVLQFVANEDKYPLTEEGQKNADCVDAGKGITAQDALAIQMVDTELIDISELPVAASALNR